MSATVKSHDNRIVIMILNLYLYKKTWPACIETLLIKVLLKLKVLRSKVYLITSSSLNKHLRVQNIVKLATMSLEHHNKFFSF